MSECQTALIFYLKFANINFPRVRKGRFTANPDLEIRWGGGRGAVIPDPEISGVGLVSKEKFFFGPSVFSLKINGGGAFLAPPPGSATGEMWTLSMNKTNSFSFIRRYFRVLARLAVY